MFIKNGFRIIIWEWPFQTASSGVFSFFLYFGIKIRFRQLLGVSALLALWFCIPYDFILLVHINILHNIFSLSYALLELPCCESAQICYSYSVIGNFYSYYFLQSRASKQEENYVSIVEARPEFIGYSTLHGKIKDRPQHKNIKYVWTTSGYVIWKTIFGTLIQVCNIECPYETTDAVKCRLLLRRWIT